METKASGLRLSEVIGALSHALDVTDGQPAGHALRSCMIGMRLVRLLGLEQSQQTATFYGLLMKDAGCSSNAAAVAALYGDDLAAKSALRTVNYSKAGEATRYIAKAAGARNFIKVARSGKDSAAKLTEIRCERGAGIARMLGLPDGAAAAIGALGEHWDGKGHPLGLSGEEIPLLARVFLLAQTAEVFVRDFGIDAACEMAAARSGTWFDPALVEVFRSLRGDAGFWASLEADSLAAGLDALEPEDGVIVADDAKLDRVAEAFALVIDAKSPYTYRHSSGVAEIAAAIGIELGFAPAARRDLRRAALLHDIGKLAVPNSILDKNGPLTAAERTKVELHPRLSEEVLGRVTSFAGIAAVAGAHHEKLDGTGYWKGLAGAQLSQPARVLAVSDIYDALTTDRPYRGALDPEVALGILRDGVVRGELCGEVVEALQGSSAVVRPLAA